MFGKLKEKLKTWISENKEENTEEESEEKVTKEKLKTKIKEKSKKKKSLFSKLKEEKSTEKSKEEEEVKQGLFFRPLTEEKFDNLFQELQIILLQHNVAYESVEEIKSLLKESLIGKSLKEINLKEELKKSIENLLINPPSFLKEIKEAKKPFIILFSGINGSGKTTTIAKIAHYLQKNSLTVCLAAADTFRAAAIQQLEEHGKILKIPTIKKEYGSDSASVGYDAIKYAKKNSIDVVLIDTAGRMQNSSTLMKEIEKISKVTSPNMKIFLGESTTGNDATLQAKAFNDSIGLTGIILSKADVDEFGGTAISVTYVTKVPILFLGTGQNYEDLEIFDKEKLIKKLGL